MVNFNEAGNVNSPIHTSTPACSEPDQQTAFNQESSESETSQWKNFMCLWGLVFLAGTVGLYLLYKYFPGYMLLCLT